MFYKSILRNSVGIGLICHHTSFLTEKRVPQLGFLLLKQYNLNSVYVLLRVYTTIYVPTWRMLSDFKENLHQIH